MKAADAESMQRVSVSWPAITDIGWIKSVEGKNAEKPDVFVSDASTRKSELAVRLVIKLEGFLRTGNSEHFKAGRCTASKLGVV